MSSGQFRSNGMGASQHRSHQDVSVDRYWLRIGSREIPLEAGETLIGRDQECQIVVTEALVSRRHARIIFEGSELDIEDLGSTNGTFVNRARLHGRRPLQRGDCIFVGSCAIQVELYAGEGTSEEASDDEELDRQTPSSGVSVIGRVGLLQEPPEFSDAGTERGARKTTVHVDALASAGRLADRMFALGRSDAGRQILSEPLEEILVAARSGPMPNRQLVDAVGRHAMRLAYELLDGRWVDLAIEIHLIASRPLRGPTLEQLVALRDRVTVGDDALIARYYERLRSTLQHMDLDDLRLFEQIATLIPRLDVEE